MPRVKTSDQLSSNVKKLTTTKRKPPSKPRTKKKEEIKCTRSGKKELFPHETFPFRLDHKDEKKTCWFECYDHAEKYINRYSLTSKDYTLKKPWSYDL
jgi:hypothetical protein